MRLIYLFVCCALALAACQPTAEDAEESLPTLAVLPSITPTDAPPAETDTPAPSDTPAVSATFTPTPTSTTTPTQAAPTVTPNTAASQTAAAQRAPRLATLTPAPGGSAGRPQVMADVVITEAQFQAAVNQRIITIDSIQSAQVNFVPEGIEVQLTALGGQAFTTATVLVAFELQRDFVQIMIGDIRMSVPQLEPSEAFIEVVGGDFFIMIFETFDSLITERLGEEHNLQTLVFVDDRMEISLLVPD